MKLLWLHACSRLGVVRSRPMRSLAFKRDCFHAHCVHTRQQERRAESLAIDFPIDLFGRLVDAVVFEQSRELLEPDMSAPIQN